MGSRQQLNQDLVFFFFNFYGFKATIKSGFSFFKLLDSLVFGSYE